MADNAQPTSGIAIAIPTRNRCDDLRQYALPSIERQTTPPDEVVIVDSSDGRETQALVDEWARSSGLPVRYEHTEDQSINRQRNRCAAIASAWALLYIDDDLELASNAIEAVRRRFDSEGEKIACVTGRVLDKSNSWLGSPPEGEDVVRIEGLDCWVLRSGAEASYAGKAGLSRKRREVSAQGGDTQYTHGGLTAWRRDVLLEIPFPAEFSGYVAQSDTAYSILVGREHRLYRDGALVGYHYLSSASRPDPYDMGRRISFTQAYWYLTLYREGTLRDVSQALELLRPLVRAAFGSQASFAMVRGVLRGYRDVAAMLLRDEIPQHYTGKPGLKPVRRLRDTTTQSVSPQ